MVFESIVAYFLEKYLSDYIDNFDASKLKIGIWSGNNNLFASISLNQLLLIHFMNNRRRSP
jgi:hypothetical protein